jgi:hypothetical protein
MEGRLTARHSRYWHLRIRCRSSPGSRNRGMVPPREACRRGDIANTPPQSSIRELSFSSVAPFRHSARAGRRRTLTTIFSYASTRARSFPIGVGVKPMENGKRTRERALQFPFWNAAQENLGRKNPVTRLCSSNAAPNSPESNASSREAFHVNPASIITNATSARYLPTANAVPRTARRMPV